ncbi:Hypothetical protein CAP_3764 [Chondromyces apiculatus DSM 436]|uniref:Uncharacterized protein n=1 Tax=Chondromyces apiculatus DSM 436 TaxID=1192034 RepID=A0A017T6R6_9BACT|nr:Hypothetical protein CAP_3764 [Chondromyces apiculatus DSM 436]
MGAQKAMELCATLASMKNALTGRSVFTGFSFVSPPPLRVVD